MTKHALPTGWRLEKFGDVVDNMNETTKDPESIGLDRVVGLDHMDPESLPLKRWDNFSDLHEGTSFTRVFRSGQVLFGKRRAYQRKVSLPDFDGICSGDILVFQPKNEDLLPEFLPYLVQSEGFFDHALGTSAGSLSPRTKWQELAKYEFSLPPIAEQHRIIKLMVASDENIQYKLGLGRVLSECKKSFFSAAVQGSSTPTSVAWGEVSSARQVVKLGTICAITRGSSPRPKGDPRYFSIARTPHHWIMIADLARSKKGKFLTDTAQFLTAAGVEKSREVEPGTLLLTNCATVGVPVFSGISGCFHDGFLLFEPQVEKLSKEFLFRVFEYLTDWFPSISQTGTQANLNTGILKELEIPLLSLIEQDHIVYQLDAVDALSLANEAHLSSLTALRGALLSSALVRGD